MKALIFAAALFFLATVYVVMRHKASPPPQPAQVSSAPAAPLRTQKLKSLRMAKERERVDIAGALRDRKIISMVVPEYPEWAEVSGVSGNVSAKIWVNPEGQVSSFMQVTQMSTEPRLDELALEALRQWRFAAAPAGSEKQSGVVTFRFVLESRRPAELALARIRR